MYLNKKCNLIFKYCNKKKISVIRNVNDILIEYSNAKYRKFYILKTMYEVD
jgi:hypothetical protein